MALGEDRSVAIVTFTFTTDKGENTGGGPRVGSAAHLPRAGRDRRAKGPAQ
jgi:hypothetical protein